MELGGQGHGALRRSVYRGNEARGDQGNPRKLRTKGLKMHMGAASIFKTQVMDRVVGRERLKRKN